MNINSKLIAEAIGLSSPMPFTGCVLGMSDSIHPNTLSFLDDRRFSKELLENPNITVVFSLNEYAQEISRYGKLPVICEEPRYSFFTLYNYVAEREYMKKPNLIHKTAFIDPRAYVADYNVVINSGSIIEPNATVLPDVEIGSGCKIRPGAIVGCEGFEYKKTSKGLIPVFHDGKVIIGDDVVINSGTCVLKGFSFRDTVIETGTKINNLVQVSHCVHIGKRCLITSNVCIAGSVTIGDDVWIGPSTTILNKVSIGNNSHIGIASVVTQDVAANSTYLGSRQIARTGTISGEEAAAEDTEQKRIKDKILRIAGEVFPNENNLSMDSNKDNTYGWDSLGNMNLIITLEDEFSVEFTEEDYLLMSSLIAIYETICGKLS